MVAANGTAWMTNKCEHGLAAHLLSHTTVVNLGQYGQVPSFTPQREGNYFPYLRTQQTFGDLLFAYSLVRENTSCVVQHVLFHLQCCTQGLN